MNIQYYTQHQICHTIKAPSGTSVQLGVLPRMKCARFTSRRCVRQGAAYRSQPLRTVTGLSILGGHAASGFLTDMGSSLLVISVLALQESKTQIIAQQVCVRGSTPEDETDPTPAHTQDERWTGHGWPATKCLACFHEAGG